MQAQLRQQRNPPQWIRAMLLLNIKKCFGGAEATTVCLSRFKH